jgi:hypothetical protein
VISTRSPVVVQELPGRNVLLLRRAGNIARVEEPEIETFGEHIGLLTSRVFNLDNSQSDFRGWLIGLAASRSLEEIEDLFALGLSSQARVIVQSEIRERAGER